MKRNPKPKSRNPNQPIGKTPAHQPKPARPFPSPRYGPISRARARSTPQPRAPRTSLPRPHLPAVEPPSATRLAVRAQRSPFLRSTRTRSGPQASGSSGPLHALSSAVHPGPTCQRRARPVSLRRDPTCRPLLPPPAPSACA